MPSSHRNMDSESNSSGTEPSHHGANPPHNDWYDGDFHPSMIRGTGFLELSYGPPPPTPKSTPQSCPKLHRLLSTVQKHHLPIILTLLLTILFSLLLPHCLFPAKGQIVNKIVLSAPHSQRLIIHEVHTNLTYVLRWVHLHHRAGNGQGRENEYVPFLHEWSVEPGQNLALLDFPKSVS